MTVEEECSDASAPGGAAAARKGPGRWRRLARRRLPVLRWAPRYSRGDALADLVAGVTLGCTLVPQSIAYAALANLPVHYGLYSSFVGTMLYVALGTVKEVSIGPTSLMALLTLQVCHGLPVQYVVLLTFLSGCVVFAMGLLQLGFMVDLISPSVTSGFTSGTAVIIMAAQVKGLLGLSFLAETLLENVSQLAAHVHRTRLGDALLGFSSCAVLLTLRKLKDIPVGAKRRSLRKALWLVSIARNALVVLAAALLAYCTHDHQRGTHPYFLLSGKVEAGLPALGLPPFSVQGANGTEASFGEMVHRLFPGILLLPVVMVLANIAIAKAFSGGARVDATQEMLTLGLCNMAGALVQAMPTCGAFTRSAVSHASGVRSPLAGLYSGVITLLALSLLTQYFFFIPRATLSAVLICAVMFMVDTATVRRLWRGGREERGELAVLALTLAVSLLATVELALLAGALAALARLLRDIMRPRTSAMPRLHKTAYGEAWSVQCAPALVYVSAEHEAARLARAAAAAAPAPLLADCRQLALLDDAALQVLERLVKKLPRSERLVFFNASGGIARRLRRVPGLEARALLAPTAAAAMAALGGASAGPAPADPAAAPLLPGRDVV